MEAVVCRVQNRLVYDKHEFYNLGNISFSSVVYLLCMHISYLQDHAPKNALETFWQHATASTSALWMMHVCHVTRVHCFNQLSHKNLGCTFFMYSILLLLSFRFFFWFEVYIILCFINTL